MKNAKTSKAPNAGPQPGNTGKANEAARKAAILREADKLLRRMIACNRALAKELALIRGARQRSRVA